MNKNEAVELLMPEVKKAARAVVSEWPGVIELDDVEQEVWVRLLDPGYGLPVETLVDQEPAERYKILKAIGHRVAAKEREDYAHFSGNYRYGTDEVRKYLKNGILYELTDDVRTEFDIFSPDNPGNRKPGYIDTDMISVKIDMEEGLRAVGKSKPHYVDALISYYVNGLKLGDSEMKRVRRAADALTREMNRASRSGFAQHRNAS